MAKFVARTESPIVKDNGTFQIVGDVVFETPEVINKVTIASWTKASDKSISTFPIMDAFNFMDQNDVEWVCVDVIDGKLKFKKKRDIKVTR